MQEIFEAMNHAERLFVLIDYDGTMVPIAPTPDQADPPQDLLRTLRALASIDLLQLAVISGRALQDLERLLPLDTLFLVGNHGVEIRLPTGERHCLLEANDIPATMSQLEAQLREALTGLEGCVVENKGLSLALHYRLASAVAASKAIEHFTRLGEPLVHRGTFEWLNGKKIFELRPAGMNKGRAVQFLLTGYARPHELPVYLGDDLTDEDAFRVLTNSGITILVSPQERPSLARYRLNSPTDVRRFLKTLVKTYGSRISVL